LSLLADNLSQLQLIATSLDEIAKASGFWSAEVLRRAFARRLGVTPVTWPAMLIQAPQQRNLVFWLAIRKLRLMDGAELQGLR
jgi:AraC-like DNA-binding protein